MELRLCILTRIKNNWSLESSFFRNKNEECRDGTVPKIGKGISVACNNNPTIAFKSSELFHIHVHVKTWVGKVWTGSSKTKDKKVEVCVCVYKLTLTPQHSIDFTLGEGVGQLRVGVEDVIWGWQNKVPNYTDSSSCHGSSCIT